MWRSDSWRQRLLGRLRGDVSSGCARCGGGDHLIEDDGLPLCRICLFAWGRLAAELAEGLPPSEPSIIELRHRTHSVPMLACPRCRSIGLVRRFRALDGLL